MSDQAGVEGREGDQPGIAGRETAAETAERLRHGSSFGAAAAAYAEHRPVYAETAVGWALGPVRDRRPLRVADIGAGTGKLTAMLVRLGADVTAVEPDPQMLAELQRTLPEVHSVPGRAEKLPLADASVDAVLAGQAMHWFDLDRALPEIARVLTPGGVLAGLWNVDDDRVGWVAELAIISKRKSSPTLLRWRDGEGRGRRPSWPGRPRACSAPPRRASSGTGRRGPPTPWSLPSARTPICSPWMRPNGVPCLPGYATSWLPGRRRRRASSRCHWSRWPCGWCAGRCRQPLF